jgi:hypothetical protein
MIRTPLLTDKIKSLALNEHAPMPREEKMAEKIKQETKESIKSWQRLQRMHLVRGERNE